MEELSSVLLVGEVEVGLEGRHELKWGVVSSIGVIEYGEELLQLLYCLRKG